MAGLKLSLLKRVVCYVKALPELPAITASESHFLIQQICQSYRLRRHLKAAPPLPTTPHALPPPTNPQTSLWTAATTTLPETESGIAIQSRGTVITSERKSLNPSKNRIANALTGAISPTAAPATDVHSSSHFFSDAFTFSVRRGSRVSDLSKA